MSSGTNRFAALLGEENTEIDKLGNNKPAEKKESDQPPTRREQRRTIQKRVPAVSPPSRRERGSRQAPLEENTNANTSVGVNERAEKRANWKEGKNSKNLDRHSRTGIYDNEKKSTMGWGEAGTSEFQGANDVLDPKDPNAPDGQIKPFEFEDNTKTFDQYLQEKKQLNVPSLQPRKANEGSDGNEWKDAVALQKEEDNYFVGKEDANSKSKSKSKKGKVYLEIDQPAHQSGRHQGRQPRGRQHGKRGEQTSVNLSDVSAFPTLGA
ncbi:unnamed protein product [Rhizopus stolonifer]